MQWSTPLLILAMTGGVDAGVTCAFTTECVETEPCSDASFIFDYDVQGDRVVATTDVGELTGQIVKREPGLAHYVLERGTTMYFLSVKDNRARLSVHVPGPIVVGYLGRCEGGQ